MASQIRLPQEGCQRVATVKSGTVIVFGDRHIWPGEGLNVADKALHTIIKTIKPRPKIICLNGDLWDLPSISRHPSTGYSKFPSIADELEAGKAYLRHIDKIAPRDCARVFNMGNHDNRFTVRLSTHAPEFLGVKGVDLTDHIEGWDFAWRLLINKRVVVTHWWHQGQNNATLNNILKSGADAFISNHLHGGHITPWTDFDGKVRWAVDTGCMAEFDIKQTKFTHYTRGNPVRWNQAFAVLTFDHKGMMLPPELCHVIDGIAYFRGARV